MIHNKKDDQEEDGEGNDGHTQEEGNSFPINPGRRPVVGATKEELEATCAKWCRVLNDGRYQLDLTKLKCLLSQDERNDTLLVRNLVHGTIVSAQVHPLIFETSSEEDEEMVRLRSLPFFDQLLADAENSMSNYRSLNDEQKLIVAVGVRDLFLGAWHGMLTEQGKRILDGMVKILDETVLSYEFVEGKTPFLSRLPNWSFCT